MPHRVANFFRSSATSLETTLTKTARRRDSPSRSRSALERSSGALNRFFAYASCLCDAAAAAAAASPPAIDEIQPPPGPPPPPLRLRMDDTSRSSSFSSDAPKEHAHHGHRLSFPGIHFGRSSKDSHASSQVSMDWKLESPPIVLYGDAESSTGALVSGQLFLNIKDDGVEIESFIATLTVHVTQKKPFSTHCQECIHQYTELKRWTLLPQPLALKKGEHSFPFSVLLEGHLPATVDGPLVSISYEFKAEAVPKASNGTLHSPVKIERALEVKRSLPTSELPHHSIRVFPPTNIKANVHYPHVIHPIGTYNLALRLDGIAKHNTKVGTVEYWKLKKLTWRLEETSKTIAPACGRHSPLKGDEAARQQQKKGSIRTDTRVIGEKTLFSGWKNNYAGASDSNVELELEYSLAKHAKFACDTKSRDGTEITHQLMVEMVVSQEWAPINKPALVTHTGVGRILRMHFSTVLTERSGIGISWDNEAPPIYQDVPPSPPAYSSDTFLEGEGERSITELMEPLDSPVIDGSVSGQHLTGVDTGEQGPASGEGR